MGTVEALQIQWPRYGPRLSACQSCGSALPRTTSNHQPDGDASGGKWGFTRYWPSRRDSRLSATISGGLLGDAKKDSLDIGDRASWDRFLLWLFENAGCTVYLASTTRRLGPGRGGTVSGSQERLRLMLYLAFTTVLPLATRSTCPGTALWDVHRLGRRLSDVELSVQRRMIHVVLDKLLRTAIDGASVDGDAVRTTTLLGILACARRLHERRGGGSVARVGR